MIWKYVAAAVVLLALLTGIYGKGRIDGAEKVQGQWDAQKLVDAAAFQKAVSDKEQVERERDRALREIADDLKPKLEAATDSVTGLSRRLRLATVSAGRCAVPGDPGAAAGTQPAVPVESGIAEIERDSDALWAAGATADALYDACRVAYERVRQAR